MQGQRDSVCLDSCLPGLFVYPRIFTTVQLLNKKPTTLPHAAEKKG